MQARRPISFSVQLGFDVLIECGGEGGLLVNWFLKVLEYFVFYIVAYLAT